MIVSPLPPTLESLFASQSAEMVSSWGALDLSQPSRGWTELQPFDPS